MPAAFILFSVYISYSTVQLCVPQACQLPTLQYKSASSDSPALHHMAQEVPMERHVTGQDSPCAVFAAKPQDRQYF